MTSERPTLTHERLQAILNYDPATGIFTWRTSPHGRFPVGTRAGGLQFKGYRSIKINARPNDPGVRVSSQQLDNWCVKQYRENIMRPVEAVKVEGAA